MPTGRKISSSDSVARLLKSVNGKRSVGGSETSLDDELHASSLISNSNTAFSERTGSIPPVPPSTPPPHPPRNLPSLPMPVSSSTSSSSSSCRPNQCLSSRGSSHNRRSSHSRSSSRRSPFLQKRFLIVIVIISIIFSSLTFCLAVSVFIRKNIPIFYDHTFQEGDLEACFPCDYLRSYSEQIIQQLVVSNNRCCARNSGQLSSLFKMVRKNQLNKTGNFPPTKEKFPRSHVTAHKQLMPFEDEELRCLHKPCHLKIAQEDSPSQHTHNVNLKNNSLVIKVSGCYWVYSSLNFTPWRNELCPKPSNEAQVFRHKIIRRRLKPQINDSVLVETAHTCCTHCLASDHQTSYAGGVFQLREEDHIFVSASGDLKILYHPDGSYIGLALLDGMENCTAASITPKS